MWCMNCFESPHHPRCPKAPAPPVAFYCEKCTEPVYEHDMEDGTCYEIPDGGIICGACVERMTTREALEYLGCVKRFTAA